jgi:DNA-binding response OmpR family regulator
LSSPRVLFIEDDVNLSNMLAISLRQEGYTVDEAASGEDGLDTFSRNGADVVIVDVRLPGIDGFEVTRELRRRSQVPITMVTACDDSHDVVAGLEAGADDYVAKPVGAKELAARIRALLRRASAAPLPETVLRFGDLEIHQEAGAVFLSGQEIVLTRTEFRVLCELAATPGWVVSRSQLLERVWDYDFFGDERLVDTHIGRLRAKIEPDRSSPELIVTVRGLGYKLQP